MNLNQLQYFVELAHLEHYTKAAERLMIAQPSLSHSIDLLEKELGVELFRRKGRNICLTRAGSLFLRYAQDALHSVEEGKKQMQAIADGEQGIIRLSFIYTLGSIFIPRLARGFLENEGRGTVSFRFSTGNTTQIIHDLKEQNCDVAFCSKKSDEQDVEYFEVGDQKLVVAVPSGHPLAVKKAVDLADTIAYPHIFYHPNSGLRPVIDELFSKIGRYPAVANEVEEDGTVAGLVAENFGIAVMPDIPILKYLDVEPLELLSPQYARKIYMAVLKDCESYPALEQFIRYVSHL